MNASLLGGSCESPVSYSLQQALLASAATALPLTTSVHIAQVLLFYVVTVRTASALCADCCVTVRLLLHFVQIAVLFCIAGSLLLLQPWLLSRVLFPGALGVCSCNFAINALKMTYR